MSGNREIERGLASGAFLRLSGWAEGFAILAVLALVALTGAAAWTAVERASEEERDDLREPGPAINF